MHILLDLQRMINKIIHNVIQYGVRTFDVIFDKVDVEETADSFMPVCISDTNLKKSKELS